MPRSLRIRFVPGRYVVARLAADESLPDWFNGQGFRASVWSEDEVTLVCLEERVPYTVKAERGWSCLRTIGPFPFDAAGIVEALIAPLSQNGIAVFVLCTFDGEHVLIPEQDRRKATECLETAGHIVEGAAGSSED